MVITNVRTWQPVDANSPPDWRTSLGQIAVAVETAEGVVGYGVGGGGAAGMHVIDAVLGPMLIGRDAEPLESMWEEMYGATLPFGRKGIAVMALSGVDLALWDLRAKRANQSVAELLGGGTGRTLPTYTTLWNVVDAETLTGGQAVKLHVRLEDRSQPVDQVVTRVAAAREALGPDRELMIDAWMEWDVDTTLEIARQIEGLRIGWIEEPISADDLEGYRRLRDECPIPIAGGEHEFTAIGFAPLIEERLHQVLQPDVCWCGGLTELVKIYQMAAEAGLRVVPHRGSEVWGLHAIAALDSRPLAESGRPWMSWVRGQPAIREGLIEVPEELGFGVTLAGDE
ncbi:MAG: mandelate racemase/muconate lactonizing enzyme family protein [Planctomycetota bacterium]|nr:MAG: mandelate racemase/muconate lactonizing enzyme family protein [Planctomycetota bacterium]REK27327.1 MAG: mandelate racemase/muconate lactonizing enzyme family protein [Planctomycetota bacterium]REK36651.1 MAG: mandelate racemase/muconate lactonizing enzyme family protein [Planctomycetota bacterium]